jgi:AcrR family transcriptional regulator
MGVQERRARERQELRQEILDAARDLFVGEGFENVSMRKIAEKIEYSPTTIYLYFEDKADLLDCICEETFAKLDKKLTALESSTADPLERLRRGLRAYIEFGLKHPNDYRVAFILDLKPVADPERLLRCHAMGDKTFDHMRQGVSQCVATGLFRPLPVEATSQALWAAIHGLTSLLIVHSSFPWVERNLLIDTLLDGVLGGLRAHPA